MNKSQKNKSARRKFEATPRTVKILAIVTEAMGFAEAEIVTSNFINECLHRHFATKVMQKG